MEINKDNIAEAVQSEEFKTVLLPLLAETDGVKSIIDARSDVIYKSKIDDEVRNLHSMYDNDMFEILGERPAVKDGTKQKTYDKMKELLSDLKELRGQKDSLNKDAEVARLNTEIERLKNEGGGKHVQEIFDQAKLKWESREAELNKQIESIQANNLDFKKKTQIQSAIGQIKFNPDTPDSIKQIVIDQAEQTLIKNSKFEGEDFIILDETGKPSLNSEYKPMTAFDALMSMNAIKDIALKADKSGGGGADTKFKGLINTSVDGKDTKKLVLPEGSFKSKVEFQNVAKKALMDAGISMNDDNYTVLMDQAYKDYQVAELPTTN